MSSAKSATDVNVVSTTTTIGVPATAAAARVMVGGQL